MQRKPLLSIGIIFKNEIRCLERCLKSFQELRDTIPCEVVMADTGSTDGSREVAERYADILFDFPWVNDFSAARNAVMDRCSGEWFLTVDADEWLDSDISQLYAFLRVCERAPGNMCTLVIRNYATAELDWNIMEFMATRMIRMSTGIRYSGAIHEQFDIPLEKKSHNVLDKVILHHDGYVCLNDGSPEGKQKIARNLELLEKELETDPHNMRLLAERMDCCGQNYEKKLAYARQALPGIEEHWEEWRVTSPHILRHAAQSAGELDLPEISEWVALAEEVFPDSVFTKIDIQFLAAGYAWKHMDCAEVICRGEKYLQGLKDYRSGDYSRDDLLTGSLHTVHPHVETDLRPGLALSYLYEGQPDRALETLQTLDYDTMSATQTGMLAMAMLRLHSYSRVDTAPLVKEFWEKIRLPKPNKGLALAREQKFLTVCAKCFTASYREEERIRMENPTVLLSPDLNTMSSEEWKILSRLPIYRHAYSLFVPLLGRSELGTASAILDSEDPEDIADIFSYSECVQELPISALQHALDCGMVFPLPGKTLNLEEMDSLASRLVHSDEGIIQQIAKMEIPAVNPQPLCWTRGLILAAVQQFSWDNASPETGLALARNFARIEKAFLPLCFSPNALRPENLFLLPPMHRIGWYCTQAFDLLDNGDARGYVRALRQGLDTCKDMKAMVEFLTEHTPELQAPPAAPELLHLAEQVRTLLAAYPADDPAVLSLKQSDAYQVVARLIEGPELGIYGGSPQ